MLTKFNPCWPSQWPLTFSFFCFLWLLGTTGPVLGKAFSVAHKGPAFLLPSQEAPRRPRGQHLCKEAGDSGRPASSWSELLEYLPFSHHTVALGIQATEVQVLWMRTLNKLLYCCSTDCKISRFTVAKKEKRRRRRRKKGGHVGAWFPLW